MPVTLVSMRSTVDIAAICLLLIVKSDLFKVNYLQWAEPKLFQGRWLARCDHAVPGADQVVRETEGMTLSQPGLQIGPLSVSLLWRHSHVFQIGRCYSCISHALDRDFVVVQDGTATQEATKYDDTDRNGRGTDTVAREDRNREIGALLDLFFLDFISQKVQYR